MVSLFFSQTRRPRVTLSFRDILYNVKDRHNECHVTLQFRQLHWPRCPRRAVCDDGCSVFGSWYHRRGQGPRACVVLVRGDSKPRTPVCKVRTQASAVAQSRVHVSLWTNTRLRNRRPFHIGLLCLSRGQSPSVSVL